MVSLKPTEGIFRTHAAFFFAWCQACEVFIQSARYRWIPVKPFKVPVHHSFSNSSKYSDTWHVSRKFSTRHAEICCHQQLFSFQRLSSTTPSTPTHARGCSKEEGFVGFGSTVELPLMKRGKLEGGKLS